MLTLVMIVAIPKAARALDDMVDANDKLVSYLLETGSIVALAQRLDQEDDSLWTVAEEDRPAIHA